MKLINAAQLDNYCETDARKMQGLLPELIRKLILTSAKKIDYIRFPSGDGVAYAGWDGIANSRYNSLYLPSGDSAWEMGIDKNILNKINVDYKKRTNNPNGVEKEKTTFCFVTPRIWHHPRKTKQKWISEKSADNEWKNILVLDANDLEVWLERNISVALWLIEELKAETLQLETISGYWTNWAELWEPNIPKELVLSGRSNISGSIIGEIEKCIESTTNRSVSVYGNSREEVIAVIIASILEIPDDHLKKYMIDRAIIVKNQETWDLFNSRYDNLILIPAFKIYGPINNRNTLIIPKLIIDSSDESDLVILHMSYRAFSDGLSNIYSDINVRGHIAQKVSRDICAFRRFIYKGKYIEHFEWTNEDLEYLLPILMVGEINTNKVGDKRVIEKLLNGKCTFTEYIAKLTYWLKFEQSPLRKIGENFVLTAADESWDNLWHLISSPVISNFEEVISEIFGTYHPKFDLEESKRFASSVYGKYSEYSEGIKEGIITSLIMLAIRDGRQNNFISYSTQVYVDNIVRGVFNNVDDWKKIFTIIPYITQLVEASPKAVLEFLSKETTEDNQDFYKMFSFDNYDFMTSSNYYTHILWALEKLMWSMDYVAEAISILAKLSEKDFKYKISNSPDNTLSNIFISWNPQCILDESQRMEMLKIINEKYPIAARKLLVSMLPDKTTLVSEISRPKWRELKIKNQQPDRESVKRQVNTVTEIMLNNTEVNQVIWLDIFENIDAFSDEVVESILSKIQKVNDKLEEQLKVKISETLIQTIHRHREFPDAEWALEEKRIGGLEDIYHLLKPEDIYKRNRVLLRSGNWDAPILHPAPIDEDYDNRMQQVINTKEEVVNEIFSKDGVKGLIKVFSFIYDDYSFGNFIAKLLSTNINYDIVEGMIINNKLNILHGYLDECWINIDKNELESYLLADSTGDDLRKTFLRCLSLNDSVLETINDFDSKLVDLFWENVYVDLRKVKIDTKIKIIRILLSYKRANNCIGDISYNKEYAEYPMLKLQVLQNLVENANNSEEHAKSAKSAYHEVFSILKDLYDNPQIDNDALINIELFYIPFMHNQFRPKALLKEIATNPDFYCEVLEMIYLPENERKENEKITDYVKHKYYWELKNVIIDVPWIEEEKKDKMCGWFDSIISRLKERGLGEIGYDEVGRILSYSPIHNGSWPHEFVCEYYEENINQPMKSGFVIGKRNQRGVYTVTNGEDEKKLAKKYREYAELIKLRYPKMANALYEISEGYLMDAHREIIQEQLRY